MSLDAYQARTGNSQFMDQFDMYVSMHDTDAAGVVYATNPANWANVGCENLFRKAGWPLERILTEAIHFPVVRVEINHHRRLPLGTRVTVRTWIAEVRRTSFRMDTTIEDAGEKCASVSRTAVAVRRGHGPVSVPEWLRELAAGAGPSEPGASP